MDKLRRARILALGGYFGLILLLPLWYGWLSPPQPPLPLGLVLGILMLPLLFPLRGLLQGRPYTYAWASFISLIYLIHASVELYSTLGDRYLALLELLLSFAFYLGCVRYAKLGGRHLKERTTEQEEETIE